MTAGVQRRMRRRSVGTIREPCVTSTRDVDRVGDRRPYPSYSAPVPPEGPAVNRMSIVLRLRPGQPDRRRRGRRAAGLGRQGTRRERDRCRRHAHQRHHRVRRQEAHRRRRRRRGMTRGRRGAGRRAARDEQDPQRGGPRGDSRRSGSAARRCRRLRRSRGSACARGRAARCRARRSASRRARPSPSREVGAPEGTLVEVAELFFNLPARRKFLKADTAESAQVSRLVTQLALGYPEVGFVLGAASGCCSRRRRPARSRSGSIRSTATGRTWCRVAKEAAGITRARASSRRWPRQGPVRGPQHVFVNRPHRPRPHDLARDSAGLQRGDDQGAQPGGASVHRAAAGSRRRERASDEGRGAVSRPGSRARGAAPRHRRCARATRPRRNWCWRRSIAPCRR